MSVGVEITERGLDQALAAMERLAGWDHFELMDTVGRTIQLQTRRRLSSEKTSPDGIPWKETQRDNPTLYNTGTLHDSIDYRADLNSITVGSPLIYATIHQFGGIIKPKNGKALAFSVGGDSVFAKQVTIPARPYMGVSTDNAREIDIVIADFMEAVLK